MAGRGTGEWVGLDLLRKSYHFGILTTKSGVVIRWTAKIVNASTVNAASFEGNLGHVMCVAGAPEHETPFLLHSIAS